MDIHTDYPDEYTRMTDDELYQHNNDETDHFYSCQNDREAPYLRARTEKRKNLAIAFQYFHHRLVEQRQHAIETRDIMQDERDNMWDNMNELTRDYNTGRTLLLRANAEIDELKAFCGWLQMTCDALQTTCDRLNGELYRMQRDFTFRENDLGRRLRLIRDNLQERIRRLTGERDNARAQTTNARNQYIFVYDQLVATNNGILQFTIGNLTRIRDRLRQQVAVLRMQIAWYRARAGPPVPPPVPPQIIWIPRS